MNKVRLDSTLFLPVAWMLSARREARMLLLLRGRAGVAFFDLGLGLWVWDRYWRYVCVDEYEVIQLTIPIISNPDVGGSG